jgi:hypothetical protein
MCSRRAGVIIYDVTDLTTERSVVEGDEAHVRSRFVFHDQNARLWVELHYCCLSHDSDLAYGRGYIAVVQLPFWRPIVDHLRVMSELHYVAG